MNKLPSPDDIFSTLEQVYKLKKEWFLAREDRGFLRFVREKIPTSETGYRMQVGNIRAAIRDLTLLLDDVRELEDSDRWEREHGRS